MAIFHTYQTWYLYEMKLTSVPTTVAFLFMDMSVQSNESKGKMQKNN